MMGGRDKGGAGRDKERWDKRGAGIKGEGRDKGGWDKGGGAAGGGGHQVGQSRHSAAQLSQ